ncbi:PAS domain-containing protein [Marinigracilibium pacificum]|uniref:PAS domain-containing protein n=1 Tax=Marinigracilibium pacificum TaxID=2729599 RepID=A0A848J2I0_9BACT|nr:PAS domain-containing protein [Marinigracilibium pacificum]NMM49931.1 PAS domain-containing protein [Marinigracilibium pacificum]
MTYINIPRIPLHCWDIISLMEAVRRNEKSKDLNALTQLKSKLRWKSNPEKLLRSHYHAIVLTDYKLNIHWVNQGFTKMTGYNSKEIIGNTPAMFQGRLSLRSTNKKIRRQLSTGKPFTERVINYKKNGQIYTCELNIFPLRNKNNQVSHFLALEKEIL